VEKRKLGPNFSKEVALVRSFITLAGFIGTEP
jgi:hypothetical protein